MQAVHRSHLLFLQDLFHVPIEVYYFTAVLVVCFRGSKQKPAQLVHTSPGIKLRMCQYSILFEAPGAESLLQLALY